MNSNAIPFWKTNKNPITMRSGNIPTHRKDHVETLKTQSEEFKDYISLKEAKAKLGVSGAKISDMAKQLGENKRRVWSAIYYKKETINEIQKLLTLQKEIDPKDDINNYISNQDLMQMFNVNAHKSWEITRKHNLIRKTFHGHKAYYEKEKAIEIFSQYQKN